MSIVYSIVIILITIIFFCSPNIGTHLAPRLKVENQFLIITALGAFSSVGWVCVLFFLMKENVSPWLLCLLGLIFITMATAGMLSLIFFSVIVEKLEDNGKDDA